MMSCWVGVSQAAYIFRWFKLLVFILPVPRHRCGYIYPDTVNVTPSGHGCRGWGEQTLFAQGLRPTCRPGERSKW